MRHGVQPGVLTLAGTNTWVLFELDAERCVVVDPGPDDAAHLDAVLAEVERAGCEVALILLDPRARRPLGAVDALHAQTQAPVRALDPAWCRGTVPLQDREQIEVDGLTLQVIATPGHTADSVCFFLPARRRAAHGRHDPGRGFVAHRLARRPPRPLPRLAQAAARPAQRLEPR